jgi:hypothetical protein
MAGSTRVALDFLAQTPDVHGDRRRTADEILIPHGVEQIVAAENLARVSDQIVQQVEFFSSQSDGLAAHLERAIGRVELDFAAPQAAVRRR